MWDLIEREAIYLYYYRTFGTRAVDFLGSSDRVR